MLDKVIHSHLNEMDKLEIGFEADIDNIMKHISIDRIMENPQKEILNRVADVEDALLHYYAPEAIDNGLKLAKKIKEYIAKDKEIKVPKSKDPKLNEELDDRK